MVVFQTRIREFYDYVFAELFVYMWRLCSLHGEFSDQVLYLYIDTYAYYVPLPNV